MFMTCNDTLRKVQVHVKAAAVVFLLHPAKQSSFFWRCSWHVMTDWAKMFMTCDDRLSKVRMPEVGQISFCQRVRFFFKMLMTSTEQGTDSSLKGGLPPSCQTVNLLWHVMKDWAKCQFYWCSLIVVKSAWGGTTRIECFFFTTWAASMEEGLVVPSQKCNSFHNRSRW